MEKLKPRVCNSEMGYYISSPIYAGVDGDYLSHWQQISPYWWRLGYAKLFVERHIKDLNIKQDLLKQIETIKQKKKK